MAMYDLLLSNPWTSLLAAGILVYVTSKLVTFMPLLVAGIFYMPKERKVTKYEHNVVYLHHWWHQWTRQVPNMSPFSVKLECWMRLHKIKYEIIETSYPSKITKQIPYVILNGEEFAESSNIIEVLSNHFNVDKTDGLSPEPLAVSRGLQRMVEDSTAWTIFMDRYIYKPDLYLRISRLVEPKILYTRMLAMITAMFKKRADLHGIGRQSKVMVERTGKADIKAVSDYLGNKTFIMGDKITMADCTIFGHLCQVVYSVDFPYFHQEALTDNLRAYIDRIRDNLWPDWHIRVNPQPYDN